MLFQYLSLLPLVAGSAILQSRQAEADAEVLDYAGYKAFSVNLDGDVEETLATLSEVDYDRWGADADHIDIALAPEEISKFEQLGLDYVETIGDIGALVANERVTGWDGAVDADGLPDDSWFDSYHNYEDHIAFWRTLEAAFPDNSEWFSTGTSLQGRDIFGLKLMGRPSARPKQAIIWHGQVHAREWITGMTLEFIAHRLISGYLGGNRDVRRVLDSFDIYIAPFVNPDGFVFSTTTQRLHRKTMRAPPAGAAPNCIGVDVNRNWPNQWDTNPGGSSPNPCSQSYRGVAPASEPETQGLIEHITSVASTQDIKLYIDWHSFGNLIISPWGYTCAALPPNNADMVTLARRTGDVIQSVFGTNFTVGATCPTLYAVNGGSLDYVYDVHGAEYSYAFELRDRSGSGANGFLLPPEQIRPTGQENWAGILFMLLQLAPPPVCNADNCLRALRANTIPGRLQNSQAMCRAFTTGPDIPTASLPAFARDGCQGNVASRVSSACDCLPTPTPVCNADNCLRALRATTIPGRLEQSQQVCREFTIRPDVPENVLPAYARDACTGETGSRVRSACACLPLPTIV